MAKASPELIQHIREATHKLKRSELYQWGHMGSCNCGFLAQEITKLTKADIHERAMQRYGDWNEQVDDYCPNSGIPMDDLIKELLDAGLDRSDLKNLEKLSDPQVLKKLNYPDLHHNLKDHVIKYMDTWADLLEEQLLDKIKIDDVKKHAQKVLVN